MVPLKAVVAISRMFQLSCCSLPTPCNHRGQSPAVCEDLCAASKFMLSKERGDDSIRMAGWGCQIEAVGETEARLGAGKVGESAWPERCCASRLSLGT
jgi:hypothetical protein